MAQLPKHRVELIGKGVTGACIALVTLLVVTLVAMVAQRGIATFAVDGIDLGAFLTGTTWNPHQDDVNGMPTVGALPMISGSFAVTLLSTLFALPIAIGSAIFVVEIAPPARAPRVPAAHRASGGNPVGCLWPYRPYRRGSVDS